MNSFYDIERRRTQSQLSARYCVHAEMQLTGEMNFEALQWSWFISAGFNFNPLSPQWLRTDLCLTGHATGTKGKLAMTAAPLTLRAVKILHDWLCLSCSQQLLQQLLLQARPCNPWWLFRTTKSSQSFHGQDHSWIKSLAASLLTCLHLLHMGCCQSTQRATWLWREGTRELCWIHEHVKRSRDELDFWFGIFCFSGLCWTFFHLLTRQLSNIGL